MPASEGPRRVTLLWQRPLLSDAEVVEALGIPPSLWAQLKSDGDTPPLFEIGRRLFCRTEDLRAWIDARAAQGRPGSRRHRNAQQRSNRETTDPGTRSTPAAAAQPINRKAKHEQTHAVEIPYR
ncbi:MAG: hypothetical protein FJY54_12130 [Betaproteobacteria bacterium]|nr:hypothetical protein [Betaproteobacteria bacterium]